MRKGNAINSVTWLEHVSYNLNSIHHQHPTSISNRTICRAISAIISICNIDSSSWFGSNPELIVKHCDNRQCHNLHTLRHIAISWRLFNVRLTSHRHFLHYKLFRSPPFFFSFFLFWLKFVFTFTHSTLSRALSIRSKCNGKNQPPISY